MQDINKEILEECSRAVNSVEQEVGFLPGRYDFDSLLPANRDYCDDIAIAVLQQLARFYHFESCQQMFDALSKEDKQSDK
jgi:hypothetical protein